MFSKQRRKHASESSLSTNRRWFEVPPSGGTNSSGRTARLRGLRPGLQTASGSWSRCMCEVEKWTLHEPRQVMTSSSSDEMMAAFPRTSRTIRYMLPQCIRGGERRIFTRKPIHVRRANLPAQLRKCITGLSSTPAFCIDSSKADEPMNCCAFFKSAIS